MYVYVRHVKEENTNTVRNESQRFLFSFFFLFSFDDLIAFDVVSVRNGVYYAVPSTFSKLNACAMCTSTAESSTHVARHPYEVYI